GLGKRGALCPILEILQAAPPRLDLVTNRASCARHELPERLLEAQGTGAVHLVANQPRRPLEQLHPLAQALLEITLSTLGHRKSSRHHNHAATPPGHASTGKP